MATLDGSALIAALGTAALGTAFVFDFIAGKSYPPRRCEELTTLAYPVGDIADALAVVGVIALTGWRPGRTWSLLLAGLSALGVADIADTLQSTERRCPAANGSNPIFLIAARSPRCRGVAADRSRRDHLFAGKRPHARSSFPPSSRR